MNKAVSLHPAKNETTRLEGFVRSGKTPVRLLERSRIVLLAAEGKSNGEIAQSMGIAEHKVGRWRNRYAEEGFAGIEKDRPRGANCGGKKTRDRVVLRSKVIEWTTRRKPESATRRSTRTLAEEPGTSYSFVWTRVRSSCRESFLSKTMIPSIRSRQRCRVWKRNCTRKRSHFFRRGRSEWREEGRSSGSEFDVCRSGVDVLALPTRCRLHRIPGLFDLPIRPDCSRVREKALHVRPGDWVEILPIVKRKKPVHPKNMELSGFFIDQPKLPRIS